MSESEETGPAASPVAASGFQFKESGVAIIGGTSGVGLATGIAFAQAGAPRIVLVGRNEARGKAAVERVSSENTGIAVKFISADVNLAKVAQDVAAQAARFLGRIDVLVNSTVADYQPTLLHDVQLDEIQRVLFQQALGPMLMSRAVLPFMRAEKSGSIVNIASDAAKVPTPGETCIGAAMAAIVTFSQTLALEAKRYGVRVNVLTPSLIVNTGSYNRVINEDFSKKIFEKIVAQAHLGLTQPEDLANAILFLSSPLARRITGQVISINGGISVV